jgi:hypothetical protein
VHRLAKNHIKEETGFKAYAAFTHSVMDALGLEEFQNSLTPHLESFADAGVLFGLFLFFGIESGHGIYDLRFTILD